MPLRRLRRREPPARQPRPRRAAPAPGAEHRCGAAPRPAAPAPPPRTPPKARGRGAPAESRREGGRAGGEQGAGEEPLLSTCSGAGWGGAAQGPAAPGGCGASSAPGRLTHISALAPEKGPRHLSSQGPCFMSHNIAG